MFRKKLVNLSFGLISAFAMMPVSYGYQTAAPQGYSYTTTVPQTGGYAYYSTATADPNQIVGYYGSTQPGVGVNYYQPQVYQPQAMNYSYPTSNQVNPYPANYSYTTTSTSSASGSYTAPAAQQVTSVPSYQPAYQPTAPAQTYGSSHMQQQTSRSFTARCRRYFSDVRQVVVTFFNTY